MRVELMHSNPEVRANAGKTAIQYGPLVYCIEEVDNEKNLSSISVSSNNNFKAEFDPDLLGGIVVIKGNGLRTDSSSWNKSLYSPEAAKEKPVVIIAVPYCMWGNRTPGEMLVWIRQK